MKCQWEQYFKIGKAILFGPVERIFNWNKFVFYFLCSNNFPMATVPISFTDEYFLEIERKIKSFHRSSYCSELWRHWSHQSTNIEKYRIHLKHYLKKIQNRFLLFKCVIFCSTWLFQTVFQPKFTTFFVCTVCMNNS